MIRNGCDLMLATYPSEFSTVTDQTSATSVQAMRTSSHNILYTVVNSRAYATDVKTSVPAWKIAIYVVDVLLLALIVCLEVLAIKTYLKKKNEVEPTVEQETTTQE